MTDTPIGRGPLPRPVRGAALGVGLAGAGALATVALLPFEGCLGPVAGMLALAAVGIVVVDRIAAFHPHPRFGLGNAVTLARAGAAAVLVALAVEPGLLAAPSADWAAFALAACVLALDGVDGWLARRQGLASAFGARFDMEVDALLVIVLAALAWGLGKAGAWVTAAGLMRYGFVAAGRAWPALAAPLPPSARRRAVCAAAIGVLTLLLVPPVAPPLSEALAAAVVATLGVSFAIDVAFLVRRARGSDA